jgi:hypothetical protein
LLADLGRKSDLITNQIFPGGRSLKDFSTFSPNAEKFSFLSTRKPLENKLYDCRVFLKIHY